MKTVFAVAVVLLAVVALGAVVGITREEFDKLDARVAALERAAATYAYEDELVKLTDRVAGDETKIEKCVVKDDFDKVEARVTFLENELADAEKALFGFSRVPTKAAKEQEKQPQ